MLKEIVYGCVELGSPGGTVFPTRKRARTARARHSRVPEAEPRRSEFRCKLRPAMIYPHSNETQTSWDRGDYRVQLSLPNNDRPMGFCDGSAADLSELEAMAEQEGADSLRIDKKALKSGREIWTLYGSG